MNIYVFINSHDIRSHWEKIGYHPTTLESAWLVWQSKSTTLKERHVAWQEIIESMPDCAFRLGFHDIYEESLHSFLKQYMEIENELISIFYDNTPDSVYSVRCYFDNSVEWYEESALFHSFNEVYARAKEEFDAPSTKFLEFVKTYIGAEERRIYLRMTCNGEIILVDEDRYLTDEKDKEIFRDVFEGMWFAFPTPFRKGDIVKESCGKYHKPSYLTGTFALTSICTEYRNNGDGSDMTAHGYFVGSVGEVYHECVHNYMNLEYVRDELRDEERLLIPIGKYLQGEIDLGLLLSAQRIMLCENEAKSIDRLLNCTKKGKQLAGIAK